MIGVVIIDFFSFERTCRYIKDLLQSSDTKISAVVVIDNSPGVENFTSLINGISEIGRKHSITYDFTIQYSQIEKVQRYNYEGTDLILVHSASNLGFAKANNLGFDILYDIYKTDYVLFSNNDILFPNEKLDVSKMIEQFKIDKTIGVVGPLVIGIDAEMQSPCRYLSIKQRWWGKSLLWPVKKKSDEIVEIDRPNKVYRLIGAFMLVRAEYFQEIGKFDPYTFLYAEEMILSERLKNFNYCTVCVPEVVIIHEGGYTTKSKSKKINIANIIRMFESDMYYYQKYIKVSKGDILLTRLFFKMYILKIKTRNLFMARTK